MAANSNNAVTEAPRPDLRVRKNTAVIVITVLVMFVLVIGGFFAGVLPLLGSIGDSNHERKTAEAATVALQNEKVDLETKRDNIIEQYDAIQFFTDRYPNAPEQDTLFRDLQNSSLFAGSAIEGIATDYPQILSPENLEEGATVTPDQIVVGTSGEEGAVEGDAPGTSVVEAAPGTDVEPGAADSYPLGTIPLSITATLDGTQIFVDDIGTHFVASPYLGYYSYGGETGRTRLTMSEAIDTTPAALQAEYFTATDVSTAGWSTVFEPDREMPPYRDIENLDAMDTADLVAMYPKVTATDTVAVPQEWIDNNGYLPLSNVARSALLIDEIHNSPGRAILLRFVSGSGTGLVLSGQQFILRELPPLPESIFGDLNGDGVIEDPDGQISAGDTPSGVVSSAEPSAATDDEATTASGQN